MGLFDTLRCEYPLPDGSRERDFQTKSLGCVLETFTLTSAGHQRRRLAGRAGGRGAGGQRARAGRHRPAAAGPALAARDHGLQRGSAQALGLVDPKGLARQWPTDKLALITELEARSLSVPVRGALVSMSLPDAMAPPPGVAVSTHALWSQRVLLQSDPHHIDTLLHHLLAALPMVAASP